MDREELGGRVLRCRKALGWSQEELARRVGYRGQSAIREIEAGKVRKPGKLLELAKALAVQPEWLAHGQGEMVLQVVSGARQQGYMLQEEVSSFMANHFTLVPRYAVQASAGPGLEVHSEQIVDHLAFKTEWLRAAMGLDPHKLALITARGDSMEPAIGDGDLLLLDMREIRTLDPSIYVVRMDQSLIAKRLQRLLDGRIRIQSDNPLYGAEEVYPHEVQILGRIVWIGRKV